jgi:hypothetical protein
MGRVLRGEELLAQHLWMSAALCALLAAVCLVYVARALKRAALR